MDSKKQRTLLIGIIVVAVAVVAILIWYFQYKVPHDQAVANFNSAAEGYNSAVAALDKRNSDLDGSITSAKAIVGADDLPIDETLLVDIGAAIDEAKGVKKDTAPAIPEMPTETNAINTAASEISSITDEVDALGNYGAVISKLNDTKLKLATLINQFKGATSNVIWTHTDKKDSFFRFVAEIKNPNAEALKDVTTEWIAFDKNDQIVGSHERSISVIPKSGHIYYVGGAGSLNLSGIPSRVEFTVKTGGVLTTKITPIISVSNVRIKNAYGGSSYYVTANCKTDTDIETAKLNGRIIIKDKKGQIIDANFWSAENLPAIISAGGKFKLSEFVPDLPAVPASAEVYVYYEEES